MNRLPWQQQQWEQMQTMRNRNRIPHASLFVGPKGVGKRHFAERLACGLLCMSPTASGDACGNCVCCRLLAAGTHPDLTFVEPEEEGKMIKVDNIREFVRTETLSSQFGGHKIWVIDPADAMNRAAANALLKTLEEPRPSTLIILLTHMPGSLSATIRSRCQLLMFPTPSVDIVLPWLEGQGDRDWSLLLSASAGSPFQAMQLADDDRLEQRQQFLNELFKLFSAKNDPIEQAEQWAKGNLPLLLQWFSRVMLDLLRLSANTEHKELFNPDVRDRLRSLATTKSHSEWHQLTKQVIDVQRALEQQLNMPLQLETLLLSFFDNSVQPIGVR